jgi:glycerol-3-phosphate dehydrogenase
LLGARASIEAAPKVAQLMGRELGADEAWQRESAANFANMAQGYVLN